MSNFAPDLDLRLPRQLLLALCLSLLCAGPGFAQEPEPKPADPQEVQQPASGPSHDDVQRQRDKLEADGSIPDDERKKLVDLLDKTGASIDRGIADAQKLSSVDAEFAGAEDEIKLGKARLAEDPHKPRTPAASTPIPQLQSRLDAARSEQESKASEAKRLEKVAADLIQRGGQLPQLLKDLHQNQTEVQKLLATPLDETASALGREIRKLGYRARSAAIVAEIALLERERATLDRRVELYDVRAKLARRNADEAEARFDVLQQTLGEKQVSIAIQSLDRARMAASTSPDELSFLADANVKLAEGNLDSVRELRELQAERSDARTKVDFAHDRFTEMQKRIELVSLTEAIGLELRRAYREQLQELNDLDRQAGERASEIQHLYEGRFAAEDFLQEFALEDPLEALFATREMAGIDAQRRARIEPAAASLLDRRKALLEERVTNYSAQIDVLQSLDHSDARLRELVDDLDDYVDKHVLWIRSTRPVWNPDVDATLKALDGLVALWIESAEKLAVVPDDLGTLLLLGLAILLLLLRRPLDRELRRLGGIAGRRTALRFHSTIGALAVTALIAAPWPLLVLAFERILDQQDAALAVREALKTSAFALASLTFIDATLRPGGLGEAHFDWKAVNLARIRRHLRWLTPIIVVAALALQTIDGLPESEWLNAIGRWAVIAPTVSLALFLRALADPDDGCFEDSNSWQQIPGWVRAILRLAFVILPLLLAALALVGYAYTAQKLVERLLDTLLMLFAVMVIRGLILRWLLLSRRAVAIRSTRARIKAYLKVHEEGVNPETALARARNETVDLKQVEQATLRTVRVAICLLVGLVGWLIWSDLMPAFRASLDSVGLWKYATQIEVTTVVNGTEEISLKDGIATATLADLLISLLILFLTWVSASNVPGFIDMGFLRRTKLKPGERYAITTLTRYAIVLVGGSLAFRALGIGWSQLQWLAAGVSVGLGFGLQEIFANMVSGMILLFERPVRVGDYVTVGNDDGMVIRIQMRATTVRDWDKKELVIPNKEFVTKQVTNWSLTDNMLRLLVNVVVGHEHDPEKVRKIIDEAVASVPVALSDPAPSTVIRGLDDKGVKYQMRAFIASMDDWLTGMNGFHEAVAGALRKHGIHVAFPKANVQIHDMGPIREVVSTASERPES